jgi:RNA polymerase sigma-32 factor
MTELVSTGKQLVQYDGLEAYISRINSYPMLTKDEEYELAENFKETGDKQAAYKLVMSHMRFVVHVAKGYLGYGLPLKDLIQEGSVGLMQAVKRFDPKAGVRLATYAIHWIKSEIHEFVIRNWKMVKVATTKAQRKLFFNLRKFKRNVTWLSDNDVHMVAKELGVTPGEVTEMESRMASTDVSYDYSEDDDTETRAPNSPCFFLEDKTSNFSARFENTNWQENAQEALAEAFEKLDDRAKFIIQRRWLDENKATLQELAEHFSVSAERIRQLEKQALETLRKLMVEQV